MQSLFIFLIFTAVIIPVFIYVLIRLWELYQERHPPSYLAPLPPKDSYKYLKFKGGPKLGSKEWSAEMALLAPQINAKHILFIHGTFVGNDPHDIIRLLEELIPFVPQSVKKDIGDWFRKKMKKINAFILRDSGYFCDEYIEILKEVFPGVGLTNFVWSSGNHHMARIRGTLKLINTLTNLNIKGDDRVLLVGHSHGGQLMSLLSLMIGDPTLCKTLLSMVPDPEDSFSYEQKIKNLENVVFDFVTMGTPPRYSWNLNSKRRLINFINHRGKTPRAGRLSGILFTRDGDYLQQFGVNGSDAYSTMGPDRAKNKELEDILGIGPSVPGWIKEVRKRKRVPDFGYTLLINYKDQSIFPNILKSLLGHGIYTKKKAILFSFKQILEQKRTNSQNLYLDRRE